MRGTEHQQSPPEMQSTMAAKAGKTARIFSFSLGWIAGGTTQGWSLFDQKTCDRDLQRTLSAAELVFTVFHRKPDENRQNRVILGPAGTSVPAISSRKIG